VVTGAIVLAAAAVVGAWRMLRPDGGDGAAGRGRPVQTVRAGELQIVLLSDTGTLAQGRAEFLLEFRSAAGTLVDAGNVHASANMSMPGMSMSAGLQVTRTAVPGRYEVTGEFGMAGTWQMAVDWEGPAGRGSVKFEGAVQ
jgi:hypothetical protein